MTKWKVHAKQRPIVQNAEKNLLTLGKIPYVLSQQSLIQVDE